MKSDPKLLNVGILGYTTKIGHILAERIVKDDTFNSVVLIGPRFITYKDSCLREQTQILVDFDNIDIYANAFENLDVVFSCLETRNIYGSNNTKNLKHIINTAKVAKRKGCRQFHVICSSNQATISFRSKLRGELRKIDFDRCSIYKPGVLINKNSGCCAGSITAIFCKPFQIFAPNVFTTSTDVAVSALINNTHLTESEEIEVVSNKKMKRLARMNSERAA